MVMTLSDRTETTTTQFIVLKSNIKKRFSLIASAEVLVFRDNGQLFDSTRVEDFFIALPKDENLSLFIHKNGYISKHLSVNDKTQQITSISLDSIVEYQFIQIPCSVLAHPIFKKEITGSLVNQLKKKIDTKLSINGPHLSSCQFIKEHFIQQGIAHQRLIIEDTNAVYCSLSVRTEHLLFKQTPIKLKKMKRFETCNMINDICFNRFNTLLTHFTNQTHGVRTQFTC